MRPRTALQVMMQDFGKIWSCFFFFFFACDGDGFFPSSLAAIMDVLMSQRCGKILVGDPHQQIYTFKGAVNALNLVDHTHIFYLTQVLEISLSNRQTFAKTLLQVVRLENIWKETSSLFLQLMGYVGLTQILWSLCRCHCNCRPYSEFSDLFSFWFLKRKCTLFRLADVFPSCPCPWHWTFKAPKLVFRITCFWHAPLK